MIGDIGFHIASSNDRFLANKKTLCWNDFHFCNCVFNIWLDNCITSHILDHRIYDWLR